MKTPERVEPGGDQHKMEEPGWERQELPMTPRLWMAFVAEGEPCLEEKDSKASRSEPCREETKCSSSVDHPVCPKRMGEKSVRHARKSKEGKSSRDYPQPSLFTRWMDL